MKIVNGLYKFVGVCKIRSTLGLEIIAEKVSEILLGGLPFVYGNHYIWGDIPSMYVEQDILGLSIAIGEVDGMEKDQQGYSEYILLFQNSIKKNDFRDKEIKIDLDFHLYYLLRLAFENELEIEIVKPENN